MMGIQEIKEVIKVVADGAKLGIQIGHDKAVDMRDIPAVFKLVQDLPAAIGGISQVPAEISDMDEAESADLIAFTMSELSLEEGKAKIVVEKSLKVLVAVEQLIMALKA